MQMNLEFKQSFWYFSEQFYFYSLRTGHEFKTQPVPLPNNNLDLNSWYTFYTRALFPNRHHHICMCLDAESGKLTEKIAILPHSGRGSMSCAANKGVQQ